ncbi:MAG TPA: helix-turn-helix domain-containing protein [Gemmatimonadaceae bacterium]|nr:helix-turn-helix domain-containing protein [Gemmatimonadaceae bacterium]
MLIRDRLLEAATKVFACTGYRGATTRRIAEAAGVNEVTLFRHFGSKDALINQALGCAGDRNLSHLPAHPRDPVAELTRWSAERFRNMYESRQLIRKVMGELAEHPEIASVVAKACPSDDFSELSEYVSHLRPLRSTHRGDVQAASRMLMGVLFAEAMYRDTMPELFHESVDDAIGDYVRVFLRSVGVEPRLQKAAAAGD